jgi:hypothetical protein
MTASMNLFPCLGMSNFGLCTYNPAAPSANYFTVEGAIAALAFTLAIQQFVRPLYRFRMRAYGLKLSYFVVAVFVGAFCSVIAMLLPNLPLSHEGLLEYPVFWELMGGLVIILAYGGATLISLSAARVTRRNLLTFVRAGAELLSAASDEDRALFAEDVLGGDNIEKLARFAFAAQQAESHALSAEFDRLRSIGAPLQIGGRPPLSAFYIFAHRRELEAASIAGTFLRILSDSDFCSALVRKCPWLTVGAVQHIIEKGIFAEQLMPFIQQLGCQAVIDDHGLMAKEIGYSGFGVVPILSDALFANDFILSNYHPLEHLNMVLKGRPSEGMIKRLNAASKLMLENAIARRDYWPRRYTYGIESAYEHLSHHWGYSEKAAAMPPEFTIPFTMGIVDLCRTLRNGLANLDRDRKKALFTNERGQFQDNLVHSIASVVFESLLSVSMFFQEPMQEGWFHVIDIFQELYPFHESEPEGMDPLQQQVAVRLIKKLKENIEGWYPAISRVLLSGIGPYERSKIQTRSAYVILRDATYRELKSLSSLHAKHPDKIDDFLPANVKFDPTANTLAHTYTGGDVQVTRLGELDIPVVNLADESNWSLA